MSDVAPVPYQMPIVSQNGLVTLAWIAWLRQLFIRVGGNDAELMINPMTQIGDTLYGGTAGAAIRLAADTSNVRKFLRELSVAGVGTPPVWDTIQSGDLPTGNLTEVTSAVLTITGGTKATIGSVTIQVKVANSTQSGYLSSADWVSFNAKQSALTTGNLTEATSSILTFAGNTNCIIGSGTTIQVKVANSTQSGYLSSADWVSFNGKGSVTSVQVAGANGLSFSGGPITTSGTITASLKAPTVQSFASGSGTYSTPTSPSPLYLRVTMSGGGGGGGGSGTAGGTAASAGGDTTFGTSTAGGGGAGGWNAAGASGGSATVGAGHTKIKALSGGGGATSMGASLTFFPGGAGGVNALGGTALVGAGGAASGAGATNSGAGGAGGGTGAVAAATGSGGGAGGYLEILINSPGSSFSYGVGGAGGSGGAGTSGNAGSAGGSGYIVVEEFYQ